MVKLYQPVGLLGSVAGGIGSLVELVRVRKIPRIMAEYLNH
ncbi:MAG: hypothetical protein ACRDS9_28695 [Pseudonocardiaceae bacterium]